ncbi:MAG: AAA family ATPase [Methylococcaceae bacterium]|jgi:RecA-family ATPase
MTKKENVLFRFVDASELMNRCYAPDFLIETLFESNSLGQIFGATGSGKSFVVLDMAYCIAKGLDYHGLTTKQGNVAYICGEGYRGIGRRIKALENKYGGDIKEKLFISEQPGAFIDISVTREVAASISAIGNVNLVIIDTYHRNMGGGNENSADDFGVILRNIDTFLKPLNVAVLIIHHSGHMETDRSRGSSAIRAAMDFEYQVIKSGESIILKATKIKDGATPAPMAFALVDSKIDTDTSGNPITSAYLEYKGTASTKKITRRKLSARDEAILQTLNDAIAAHGIDPSAEIKDKLAGFNSFTGKKQKIVHIDHWRKLAHKTISVDADTDEKRAAAIQKAFRRCRDKLFNDKYTVEHGDYVWRIFDETSDQTGHRTTPDKTGQLVRQ